MTESSALDSNMNMKLFAYEICNNISREFDDCIDPNSVFSMAEDDIFSILRPSIHLKSSQLDRNDSCFPVFETDAGLMRVANTRIDMISKMLEDTRHIVACVASSTLPENPDMQSSRIAGSLFQVKSLAGDSHNGARKPILVKTNFGSFVIKWADHRPYSLLFSILRHIKEVSGVDIYCPPVCASSNNDWYATPFLDGGVKANLNDVSGFMWRIGVLTSVVYCLRMVDVHLENVIVHNNQPIIIDPECMLYMMEGDFPPHVRFLSTGFLSRNISLSALRGGGEAIWKFAQTINKNGILSYRSDEKLDIRNRICLEDGNCIDPTYHKKSVLEGFRVGYSAFLDHKRKVNEILDAHVVPDMRIRFLVRKTRHYISVLEMLKIPRVNDANSWHNQISHKFENSGSFLPQMTGDVLKAEMHDMRIHDIPYFWIEAGNDILMHRTGEIKSIKFPINILKNLGKITYSLKYSDMKERSEQLDEFLSAPLHSEFNHVPAT